MKSLLSISAVACLAASAVSAAPVDLTTLQTNGNATVQGSEIRLTDNLNGQLGSAFTSTATALDASTTFSIMFELSISQPGGGGADGIVFAMQNVAPTAIGVGGGGIGYQGITPSIGIEFDTWNNGGIDGNSANHVGININGNTASVLRADPGFNMDNSSIFGWLEYDGIDLDVFVNNTGSKPLDALLSYTTDLSNLGGQAYFGFTASTGGANAEHRVAALDVAVTAAPVPLPAGLPLMLAGLGAFALVRRTRR